MIGNDFNDGLFWEGGVALMLGVFLAVVPAFPPSSFRRKPESRGAVGGSFPSFSIMGIIVHRRVGLCDRAPWPPRCPHPGNPSVSPLGKGRELARGRGDRCCGLGVLR